MPITHLSDAFKDVEKSPYVGELGEVDTHVHESEEREDAQHLPLRRLHHLQVRWCVCLIGCVFVW